MVTIVTGNIFDSSAQVLVNPINCVGVMGAGLALQFKNKYPEMFSSYLNRCKSGLVRIGVPYLWEDDNVQIINFPTKRHWKSNSSLYEIEEGLLFIRNSYKEMGIHTMAMPALGCGKGGLRWKDVFPLVERHLGDLEDLEVFIYREQE